MYLHLASEIGIIAQHLMDIYILGPSLFAPEAPRSLLSDSHQTQTQS